MRGRIWGFWWVICFVYRRGSPLSAPTSLPSSQTANPPILLTLTGFTPPPSNFDRGRRRSLHSNTPMAREKNCVKGNGVGSHLWLPWWSLSLHHPSARRTWRKGAPVALNMWCFPAKTRSLIHDVPHPNRPNKGCQSFYFVAFNLVHVTDSCLEYHIVFFYSASSSFHCVCAGCFSDIISSFCLTGMLSWSASQPVWHRTRECPQFPIKTGPNMQIGTPVTL